MNDEILSKILQRLNISVSLQVKTVFDKSTEQEKIEFLNSFGLKPADIAEILGSSNDKISKQLYKIKKKGGE